MPQDNTFAGSVSVSANWQLLRTGDIANAVENKKLISSISYADGNGVGQADEVWRARILLRRNSVELIDVSTLKNIFGEDLAVGHIKSILVWNRDASRWLIFGRGDYFGAIRSFWSGDDGGMLVGPGGGFCISDPATGYAVTAGHANLCLRAMGRVSYNNPVVVDIVLFGTYAPTEDSESSQSGESDSSQSAESDSSQTSGGLYAANGLEGGGRLELESGGSLLLEGE